MPIADVACRDEDDLGPGSDDALEIVLGVLAQAMATELSTSLERVTTLDALRVEPLDAALFLKQHGRPCESLRLALVAPGVTPLEFFVVLSERDLMLARQALPGAGVQNPLALGRLILDAMAFGTKRGLEARLGVSWHIHSQDRNDGHPPDAAVVRGMTKVARCAFAVGDGHLELLVMLSQATAARLLQLDEEVPVVRRARLAEFQGLLAEPDTLDLAVLGEIPVMVEAVLDAAPMTVGELARLGKGSGLPLGSPWNCGMRLVAGGQVLGRGELVLVGDRQGVLLHAIGDTLA